MDTVVTITPVLNDALDLPAAVASIQSQVGVDVSYCVLAIGPSNDGSWRVAEELASMDSRIVLVENQSGRTATGLNKAIDATKSDIVVRVDARSVLPPTYVRDAIETLEASGAGNVGAAQVPVGSTLVERAIASAMRSSIGSGGVAYRGQGSARQVDTAWLGVFRRSALDAVGGYDEDFVRNQDAELNARLNAAGYKVWFDPRLRVTYRPRGSLRGLAEQYFQYGWWRLRTVRKHPVSLAPRQLAAPIVTVVLFLSAAASFVIAWALVPVVAYLMLLLFAGSISAGTTTQRLLAAVALGVMHLSWGTGFLLSALRSVVSGG